MSIFKSNTGSTRKISGPVFRVICGLAFIGFFTQNCSGTFSSNTLGQDSNQSIGAGNNTGNGSGLGPGTDGGSDNGSGSGSGDNNPPIALLGDECVSPDPSWVFCNGFEEKTSAAQRAVWDDYDGNIDPVKNAWIKDEGPFAIQGNQVHRLRVPPGRGGTDLIKALPMGYDRLYARWYVKWEAGYNFSAPSHGSGLGGGDRALMGSSGIIPNGRDKFSSGVEVNPDTHRLTTYNYYPGMYQFDGLPAGSNWGDTIPCYANDAICELAIHRPPALKNLPPQLVDNRWYCVEQMIDTGTPVENKAQADGVLNLWIDGVEIGPFKNMWYRKPGLNGDPPIKVNRLGLSLFHHDATHSVAGMMFDNVVLSSERIGCGD